MKCETPTCGNDVAYLPTHQTDENYHIKLVWLPESLCVDCKNRAYEETQINKDYTE
jgi:hypothetical protein